MPVGILVLGVVAAWVPPYPRTRPCDHDPLRSSATCNMSVPLDERLADLVARIPSADLVGLLHTSEFGGARGVPSLHIPPYQWWNEALHGVAKTCFRSSTGGSKCPTSFPAGITTSASFNRSLFRAIGDVIGTEGRAYNNLDKGMSWEPVEAGTGLTFWTPNVNVFRDPRWGRGQETPGEDPLLNSDYAAEFVSGFQSGEDSSRLKASACCKHYAAYSLEKWGGKTRHNFDAEVPKQDMQDTYLPAFQSCVQRGRASGVMCSYNSVNGVPSCASAELLDGNLRSKWGFDGYVTSDCGAVADVMKQHHYTNSSGATCAAVLAAGMDTDCGTLGSFFSSHLQDAIASRAVAESAARRAAGRLFKIWFRLGMFDADAAQPYRAYGEEVIDRAGSRELALEAARQGMVLVKNDGTLPFDRATLGSLAVVGPHGDATKAMQGNYHGSAPYLVSPVEGVRKYVPKAQFARGCTVAGGTDLGVREAAAAAASADATVAVVGLDGTQEGEGHDRTAITLPGRQNALISAVLEKARGPVVLVVMSGGPVDLSAAKADPRVRAIVIAGYPGQSGGDAIAEVLFGDANPAGRLTQTWYPANFTDECSMFEMSFRPTSGCPPGRTYRFYRGEPVFPFGAGLSYTSFQYRLVTPEHAEMAVGGLHRVSVAVTNTGSRAGDEVVLVFLVPPRAGSGGRPLHSLRRYTRISLAPGEGKVVSFTLSTEDFSLADSSGGFSATPGEWTVRVGAPAAVSATVHVL
eukprot:TRINITY_DN50566_c0_g1_i1.p1 TRINITY_DN50566_c0_g1~~TRINITY_DN50566_c0_g1_i1.p1  ORF type:complete len:776 (+),score=201.17 TRINITY_DN50566_c0_g1_i1:89-2329(+)